MLADEAYFVRKLEALCSLEVGPVTLGQLAPLSAEHFQRAGPVCQATHSLTDHLFIGVIESSAMQCGGGAVEAIIWIQRDRVAVWDHNRGDRAPPGVPLPHIGLSVQRGLSRVYRGVKAT